jgi:hypothetical protein
VLLYDVPAVAAEALRPHHGAPAVTMKYLLPADQIVFAYAFSQAHSVADAGGQFSLEKGAHSNAKCLLFGRVFQVHARSSILSLWHPAARHAELLTTNY